MEEAGQWSRPTHTTGLEGGYQLKRQLQRQRLREAIRLLDSLDGMRLDELLHPEMGGLNYQISRINTALLRLESRRGPLPSDQFPQEVLKWLEGLKTQYRSTLDARYDQLSSQHQLVYLIIAGAGLYVVFINMMLYDQIPRFIFNPLLQFGEKIRRIAEGDYIQSVDAPRDTELGDLAGSFNLMATRLQEYERSNVASLKAQKRRMDYIINELNDLIFVFDESNHLILLNQAAANLIGGPPVRWEGHSVGSMQRLSKLFDQLWSQEATQEQGQESVISLQLSPSRELHYQRQFIPVKDREEEAQAGQSMGFIFVLRDVTQFRRLDQAKTKFIATLSHELKTPLSSINMSLSLLSRPALGSLNRDQNEVVSVMRREIRRLLKMVGELLTLSRIERGKLEVNPQWVSLQRFWQEVYQSVSAQYEDKQVALSVSMPEDQDAFLYADAEKVSWALTNLLTNALRYSPREEKVEVNICQEADQWRFYVKDRGPGIPVSYQRKLFSPYFQVDLNGNTRQGEEGLGLGLSIAKEVVEAHGGRIEVSDRQGGGSIFSFTIPTKSGQRISI
jgi:signal transduction histidine kinase